MPADQWYYVQAGQQAGPVTWEQLRAMAQAQQLTPGQLVWCEGMVNWSPAGTIPGLFPGPFPAVPVTLNYTASPDPKTQRIIKNAKINGITMFVMFCLAIVTLGGCLGIGWVGAVFAAIYMPLRWRTIMGLPGAFRVLTLIGGFGLIALLMAGIVLMAVGISLR